MSIKYNDNGTFKDIKLKVGDNIPVGAEFDYDGNTIPVGYEEVDNPNNYSTTEQVIGTWIDGKPIYRKYFTWTTQDTTTSPATISNLETLVDIKGIYMSSENKVPANFRTSSHSIITWVSGSNLYYGCSGFNGMTANIFVEYTKTTDTANS